MRFDIYESVEVLWFGYMEEVVCNGDDLIYMYIYICIYICIKCLNGSG